MNGSTPFEEVRLRGMCQRGAYKVKCRVGDENIQCTPVCGSHRYLWEVLTCKKCDMRAFVQTCIHEDVAAIHPYCRDSRPGDLDRG